jgi:hypothetical protein
MCASVRASVREKGPAQQVEGRRQPIGETGLNGVLLAGLGFLCLLAHGFHTTCFLPVI